MFQRVELDRDYFDIFTAERSREEGREGVGILRILHLLEISGLVHTAKMPLIKMTICL